MPAKHPPGAESTGKMIVTFKDESLLSRGADFLKDGFGIQLANSKEAKPSESNSLLFENLGLAVISAEQDRMSALFHASFGEDSILAVEPEIICHAIQDPTEDYLQGYADGTMQLVNSLRSKNLTMGSKNNNGQTSIDLDDITWGLQLSSITSASKYSGKGIKIAVLDTGFDTTHRDFTGRQINSKSFVPEESVDDVHGHGTHCTGTAVGAKLPFGTKRRYGIAFNADVYIGKVLSNDGYAGDASWIIAGIDWAVSNNCKIVSMSLAKRALPTELPLTYFEVAAQRALKKGTLIIAAAGNDSRRSQNIIAPVGHPANCPSIMAVAAVDKQLSVAPFSNGSSTIPGGQIDIAAPGVSIYSSWLNSTYNSIDGTSMAAPHVAGIAALLAEATGNEGHALWKSVVTSAKRLPLNSSDVGAGLVQSP